MRKFDNYKPSVKRKVGWFVYVGILAISLGASWGLLREVPEEETVVIVPKTVEVQEPVVVAEPESYSSRILFTGETFWGRKIAVNSEASELGTAYPFARLAGFNREDYNVWHTQLECPITDEEITFEQQAELLQFNCESEYLPEYAKWFDIASLATNHTGDVNGEEGLLTTRVNLDSAGVDYFGHFDTGVTDELCEIIPTEFEVQLSDQTNELTNLPIAYCGYHSVFRTPTEAELDVIADYSEHFITIVSPHMGAEYVPEADSLKETVFRGMVDRGADLVVASHPHWVQNTEVYDGTLIMYSLGNFLFDQEWSEDVKKGVALDATFSLSAGADIDGLVEFAQMCEEFGDNCLELAQEADIEKPDFDVAYELVVSEFADSQTFPASEAVTAQMLERTNWEQTIQELADANN